VDGDGLFKLEGEPLSIVAATSPQKRVLRLYSAYPAANPDWMISLNPAAGSRPGLGFTDAAGNARLFIDADAQGKVGIGTVTPAEKLHVMGRIHSSGDVISVGPDPWDGGPNRGALIWGPHGTDNQGALVLSAWTNAGGTERNQEVGIHAARVFLGGGLNVNFASQLATFGCSLTIHGALKAEGPVGIGSSQAAPPAKLSLGTDASNTKLALHDDPSDLYGFGMQGGQLRIHVGNPGARISFLGSAAGPELMTILGAGNVGVGTATPAEKLHVMGRIHSASDMISVGDDTWDGGPGRGALVWGTFGANGQKALILSAWTNAGGTARHQEIGIHGSRVFFGGDLNVSFTSQLATVGSAMAVQGALTVSGAIQTSLGIVVGAGSSATLKTRHVDGKHWQNDSDDTLFLNYDTGTPVWVNRPERSNGITVWGQAGISGGLVVGAGGDAVLRTRHIFGKGSGQDGDDALFLNHSNGKLVVINNPQVPAGLEVYGELRVSGKLKGAIAFSGPFWWEQGQDPLRLIHSTDGIAMLTFVRGSFQGGGESVRVYVGEDGYWYLGGSSAQAGVAAEAYCVGRV
jgi:hypothetical protein